MDNLTSPAALKLSVLVVTYNHREYIAQALDSIFNQQFDQPFEIVVADDCSTDGTQAMVRQYQTRHGACIRLLAAEENSGITRNYQRGFAACSGEYIAVLEGDDYWLDRDRLKTLVSFLEQHPECAMVFNRIRLQEAALSASRDLQWDSLLPYEVKSGADLARQNFIGNFSACAYRAAVVRAQSPLLYDQKMYDWLFNLSISRSGLIGYIPRVLSVYRQHGSGAWSPMSYEKKLRDILELIPRYDQFLHGSYAPQLKAYRRGILDELENLRLLRLREQYQSNLAVTTCLRAFSLLTRIWRKVRDLAAG